MQSSSFAFILFVACISKRKQCLYHLLEFVKLAPSNFLNFIECTIDNFEIMVGIYGCYTSLVLMREGMVINLSTIWKIKFFKHLEKLQKKKTLKFHLELNFNNFKKGKTNLFFLFGVISNTYKT